MNAIELKNGFDEFKKHEARDSMYKIATFIVDHFWGQPREMADGLGVLLLTWNQAFYRYGSLDFEALESCLARNHQILDTLRNRNILTYTPADDEIISLLYGQFLESLQISDGNMKGRKSPVSVAKALHLLAPAFFPLWDDKIAREYECHYEYIPFIRKMKDMASLLEPVVDIQKGGRTLLKLIDEYNYSKFTKKWI
jgi:hypothetical protein